MCGKIITIEGTDGSGKETQSKLLYEKLKQEGHKVKLMSFPMYNKQWGSKVREILDGKHGSIKEINPYWFAMFYSLDRHDSKQEIEQALEEGFIIIMDRYCEASLYQQGAKLNEPDKKELIRFFRDLEHNKFGLPKSDVVFFLELDPEWSSRAMKDQERTLDIHEKDLDYQRKVRLTGLEIADSFGWEVVNCLSDNDTERRSIEDVSEEIYSHVISILKS